MLVALATPSVGVTSVGEVEKTTLVEVVPVVPVADAKYCTCVVEVVEATGMPLVSETRAREAVMADASTMDPPDDCMTRLLLSAVVLFVPPRPTDSVPVVPPTMGSPVQLVSVPLEGVPRTGAERVGEEIVGELENTTLVVPVVPDTVVPAILATVEANDPGPVAVTSPVSAVM